MAYSHLEFIKVSNFTAGVIVALLGTFPIKCASSCQIYCWLVTSLPRYGHFYPCDGMLARYCLPLCVCRSVRLSVCLSHFGVLLRRLNLEGRKQRHTIAQGLQFSDAKNHGDIPTG